MKTVNLVISDRAENKSGQTVVGDKRQWGLGSVESGGPPSLKSIEVPTTTSTPPTPYRSVEGPLSNYSTHSTNYRNQTIQRNVS